MAQPMMHLLVADKIYAEKPGSIHSYGEFLLGSIAPDAVHMREECTREQKRISHYRFHLLSDMIWYHSVRVPFMEKFQQMPSHNMSMNKAYYADCDQLEQLLFGEKDSSRIIKAVSKSKAYSLEDLIDSEDVSGWKEKLVNNYNNKRKLGLHTTYISEHEIRDYISNCSKKCIEYLEYFPYFQDLPLIR